MEEVKDLIIPELELKLDNGEVDLSELEEQNVEILEYDHTSLDFIVPDEEKNILEKNSNMYNENEKIQKALMVAKRNRKINEEIKGLEILDKTTQISEKVLNIMLDEENLNGLDKYIKKQIQEGNVSKAYKELGTIQKTMLNSRSTLIDKMKTSESKKKNKIAIKFTNDSGEEVDIGMEI